MTGNQFKNKIVFSHKAELFELISDKNTREWTIEIVIRNDKDSYYTECYWDNKDTGNMLFSIPTLYMPLDKPFGSFVHTLNDAIVERKFQKPYTYTYTDADGEDMYLTKKDIYHIFNTLLKIANRYGDFEGAVIDDYYLE